MRIILVALATFTLTYVATTAYRSYQEDYRVHSVLVCEMGDGKWEVSVGEEDEAAKECVRVERHEYTLR